MGRTDLGIRREGAETSPGLGSARASDSAPAADAVENPLIAHSGQVFRGVAKILVRSAELMPEDAYGFRPTDEVRTFGEILAHVAASQYYFCAAHRRSRVHAEPAAVAVERTRRAWCWRKLRVRV